jgi:hypothetical protein
MLSKLAFFATFDDSFILFSFKKIDPRDYRGFIFSIKDYIYLVWKTNQKIREEDHHINLWKHLSIEGRFHQLGMTILLNLESKGKLRHTS